MRTSDGRKDPEAWLMRIRTLGPGAASRPARPKDRRAKASPRRGRRDTPSPGVSGAIMDRQARQRVCAGLAGLVEAYPFGLLAAWVGPREIDMLVRCPATDLPLIADLVKRRLGEAVRQAGIEGRVWRKGFLRRAMGTEGDVRRTLGLFRREALRRRCEMIDRVRHDERLGVRYRRPGRPIE